MGKDSNGRRGAHRDRWGQLIDHAMGVTRAMDAALADASSCASDMAALGEELEDDLQGAGARRLAQKLEPVLTDEFRLAARSIVTTIEHALWSGDPSDVLWLASRLAQRSRRRWLLTVGESLELLAGLRDTWPDWTEWLSQEARWLPERLSDIDPRAGKLSTEFVYTRLLDALAKGLGPAHVAAELALACDAFDTSGQDKARTVAAFRQIASRIANGK